MGWFNWIGLIVIALIMFPNIIYAIKKKEEFSNSISKTLVLFEQIGRMGCIVFMIFNLPYTYFNFWFNNAFLVYVITNSVLVVSYITLFFILWNHKSLIKAIVLSVLPSIIFLFSGVTLLNVPLIILSITFAVCHITLSIKNV